MTRSKVALCFLAAIAALLMAGCTKPENKQTSATETTASDKPASSDATILAAVKKAFAAEPELAAEKIDITVKDGRVTLVGSVTKPQSRLKAEDTARNVPDVFGVDAERLTAK